MDKSVDKQVNTPDTGGNFEAGNFQNIQALDSTLTREKLQQILADKTLAPDLAEAIRKQLALIESGKAPAIPNELGSGGKSSDQVKKTDINDQKARLSRMLASDENVGDWNKYADDVLNAAQRNKNPELN